MKAQITSGLLAAALIGTGAPALAQALPPGLPRVTDPGLEAERAEAMRERRDAVRSFRPGGALEAAKGPAPIPGGPCFTMDDITVEGATSLSVGEITGLLRPYSGKCLHGAEIQTLMESFDQAYAERGNITTRTYLPPQNVAAGKLTLQVVEGKIADVIAIDEQGREITTGRAERQLTTAFPGVKGELFQLRDFEQGLDQMNRLKSVNAVMRLQPGAAPGESDVLVLRQQEDPFRGIVTLDNKGSDSTGQNRMLLEIEADDALGLNDTWSLGYTGSQNTNALTFDGSIPWGYWTFGLAANYSEYLLPLTETAELFGTTEDFSGKITRMLKRDQVSTTEGLFELRHNRAERFINGAALTPQWLSTAKMGLSHIRQKDAAREAYDIGLKLGLPIFNATEDAPDAPANFPKARFAKLEGGVYRIGPVSDWGRLQSDLRLQYSPDPLYPSEQVSLGSESTVRGYLSTEAIGDTGFWMRNDLLAAPQVLFPRLFGAKDAPEWVSHVQLTGFADFGAAYDHAQSDWQAAAGLGIGMGYALPKGSMNMTLATPLIEDNQFELGDPMVQLSLVFKAF